MKHFAPCLALLSLALLGCPAEPTQAPPVPTRAKSSTSAAASAETFEGLSPVASRPNALQASEVITRSEVLGAQPREVLEEVFARGQRGLLPSGWSVAVCTEQLRSADVPPQALDLVLVAIQRALNAQAPRSEGRARLLPAVRARLTRDLRLQTRGLPGLAAWTEHLLRALEERRDLSCAREFLERVHVLWRLVRAP